MSEKYMEHIEMTQLCVTVKELAGQGEYDRCRSLILEAMGNNPDAAEPHNLLGVLLERKGDHEGAMRHFRAAAALDPTYEPAGRNLDVCGCFPRKGSLAWQQADCPQPKRRTCVLTYDSRGFRAAV